MARSRNEYESIEEELVALFERLLAELPKDVASLDIRRVGRNEEGVVVTLRPQNPDAASVWAHAEKGLDLVDFGFGDWGVTGELPIEGHNPKAGKSELLQEVEELCRAVMTGKCRHKRGLLSISGSIQVGERPYKVTNILEFCPKPPLQGIRTYKPYISPS